ncbi:hypothetical protein AYI70_g2004 [Smittium culicis]|uniref:Late embryogenesis abundant protein LEA-2 subgroup domain-containing protein n=1 Tax=Smittium culicis TaxID=133412 RepID=A0A1R1XG11_9FUNG|nr:hypothetical protein AYI70_g8407 [Smittium culicis]OMJ23806.1 hypothetical protein AYI70_g2004 [Smittium culicis]
MNQSQYNESSNDKNFNHSQNSNYTYSNNHSESDPYKSKPSHNQLNNQPSYNMQQLYSANSQPQNPNYNYQNSHLQRPDQYMPLDEETKAKRRRYCCCFSKTGLRVFLVILFFFLAALAVAGYFLWPRIPNAQYKNISLSNSTAGSGTSVQDLLQAAKIEASGTITIPLIIDIEVDNPNYIPWTLNNVTLSGSIKTADGSDYQVGTGKLISPFTMPKKSTGNIMKIYFDFSLDSSSPNFLSAAALVKNSCVPSGPAIRFNYVATIYINAISWLKIRPKISDSVNFNCPVGELQSLGIDVVSLIDKLVKN